MTARVEPGRRSSRAAPRRLRPLRRRAADELGGEAVVRLRVPRGVADEVGLRYVRDGEPRAVRAQIDEETETETWWRATFPVGTRHVVPLGARRRRPRLRVGERRGRVAHDIAGRRRLRALARPGGRNGTSSRSSTRSSPTASRTTGLDAAPPGVGGAARLGRAADRPRAGHAARALRRRPRGIEQHLDHVEQLGANVIYLTPIFPADEHPPLRRDHLRPRRPAARRRRGARAR